MPYEPGTEIVVRTDGVVIKGTIVEDQKEMFIVRDEKGNEVKVVKCNIAFFMTKDGEPEDLPVVSMDGSAPPAECGLRMLARIDKNRRETGVYFIADAGKMKESQKLFVDTCKIDRRTHGVGDMGDLFQMDQDKLREILRGAILEA